LCIFAVVTRVDKVLKNSNFGNMPPRYLPYQATVRWDLAEDRLEKKVIIK
jgi:hypothetical protein